MRRFFIRAVYSFAFLAGLTGILPGTVVAQSLWQKMKDAAKQQQCQAGNQNACQDLAKRGQQPSGQGQAQGQPGQPRPGQPPRSGQQASSGGSAINASGPFKPPAGTKIEEKILAPVQDRAKFTISPHGVHVAAIETEGSRAVVWYDGAEGPKFDEIIPQNSSSGDSIVFSPDGNRYAYCARSGAQYVVMVDGKELVRSSETQLGRIDTASCQLGFTSNSKHVFYTSQVVLDTQRGKNFIRFVFDGKPGPTGSAGGAVFSRDGNHFAYVLTISDPYHQDRFALVVDGQIQAYVAGSPQWTSDNRHLYTQRTAAGTTELLYDGKPIARAFNFQVYIPQAGDMVVIAVTGGTNGHPYSFLVVNGKKVGGSETVERGMIHEVIFSPDGKHYAAHCQDLNVHHYLIVDGKRQQEYSFIDKITFTPDSSTLLYMAQVNGKTFIVAGDNEYAGGSIGISPPVLSPVGSRFAALLNNNGSGTLLLLDGKTTQLNVRSASGLSFTPDGQHYAYFVSDGGMGGHLAIDGTVMQQSNLTKVDTLDLQDTNGLQYIFSADSKHFAHFAANDSTGMRGIFVDGKFIPGIQDGVNTHLTFSPDGKHLFWIHMYGNQPHRLFVDGKPLVDFYMAGSMVSIPHWWDFNPDGTLSLLAQDDNSLKRITITLSDQTSLAAMLGGGPAMASRGN